MLKISVINEAGTVLASDEGQQQACLYYEREYEPGDRIVVECVWEKDDAAEAEGASNAENPAEAALKGTHLWLQLDEVLGQSLVYLTGTYEYRIPFGEKSVCYSPKAFAGNRHLLKVKEAREFEWNIYRNLSLNVNDQHGNTVCFPRASANVETRGESVFAAMNAIDGVTENRSHGEWPYASWGINRQDDAELTLYFGRKVEVDRVILYTRADFPHDNWWVDGRLTFSDGSTMQLPMEKSQLPHEFVFEKKTIEWLKLGELIKADDPSPFPALSQIEVYGWEI